MYKILGADGRQYGPATAEQVRRWMAEGRASGQSLAQAEGTQEWKHLSSFPEFAADPAGAPPPLMAPTPSEPPVDPALTGKASSKLAAGLCGILLGGFGVHKFILGYTGAGVTMLLISILSCGLLYWVMHIIGLIEGILYLTKPDEEFVRVYVDGQKEWF